MPNSKLRKQRIAENRRQLERVRRKCEKECNKENQPSTKVYEEENRHNSPVQQGGPGWLGSLYSWCHSGIAQVLYEVAIGPVNSRSYTIQSVEVAKDTVFPSRSLKRQLEDAQTKLKEMEDELRSMKEYENDRKRQKMEVQHIHPHPPTHTLLH